MKYCKMCNKTFPDNLMFCPECRSFLSIKTVSSTSPTKTNNKKSTSKIYSKPKIRRSISNFAVIDIETNNNYDVMSIGVVVSDNSFKIKDSRYYILPNEAAIGGIFSSALYKTTHEILKGTKPNVMNDLISFFNTRDIKDLFAYNAHFDKKHLPELSNFYWHDIMKIAAYKQYNPSIPSSEPCFKTGKLKSGFGVEPILRMLGVNNYCEVHNAIRDAKDELLIMELLGHNASKYPEI